MSERLKISKDLDTPLYWRILAEQEAGITPKESQLLKDLSKVFVLGGGMFGAMAMVSACTPSEATKIAEVREAVEARSTEVVPTPTFVPTPTETLIPTPRPTETPKPTSTETPGPTVTPTETPTQTSTRTPAPTETPKPPEPTPVPYKMVFDNMFNWPGWARPGVSISGGGSGIEVFSSPEARWVLVQSENTTSWLTVKGDFELQFKVELGGKTGVAGPTTGRINLSNRFNLAQQGYDSLTLRFEENNQFALEIFKGETREFKSLGQGKIPEGGKLRVRFENAGVEAGQKVKVFDGEKERELIKADLPFSFFKKGKPLSFGIEVGGGIKSFKVSSFKILQPEGTQNITR